MLAIKNVGLNNVNECELLDRVTNHGAGVLVDLMHDIHKYVIMTMRTTYMFCITV